LGGPLPCPRRLGHMDSMYMCNSKLCTSCGKSISKEAYVHDRRALSNSLEDADDDNDDMGKDANIPSVETLLKSMYRLVTLFSSSMNTSLQDQRLYC
jgi:hypothetical protein